MNEKVKRLKYIRVIEKFFTRVVGLVKNNSTTKDIFIYKINKYYEDIKKVEKVRLNKNHYKMIESFIDISINFSKEDDFDKLKDILIKYSNQIHKQKNKKSYS